MGIFSRARPEAVPREDPISTILRLLVETEKHPLKRIPAAGLEGEAKEIAERLNTRLDAVASAEKEQQQFIADVSHELRTPLTVLRGTLEVVLEEDRPAEEYREAIGDALLEVRHLTRLSQNLLFLARGQSGRVTLSFANVDLGRFIVDVTRDLLPAAADRGIDLAAEAPDEPVRAFIDADRMQQVLHNLLENAIRYTRPEDRIRVRLSSAPDEATIEVIDTGIGIPPADQPYVFERFFRSDRARRAYSGGSGLGLSIVRWIVEAHKGRVEVESTVDRGTTFKVRLPLI
ncbi:MAG: HAMP domain-containing histidine kinase [Acidobacteria bacterium]|nr:HAMP domain-containing histidine kinase [Acidobacteriota bacterium]MCA1610460.1 HAMP domain-containing histidine kinase [Acidobacteriota bacterium]